jgi:hypothetical protein
MWAKKKNMKSAHRPKKSYQELGLSLLTHIACITKQFEKTDGR